jgi:hypothetical protein
MQHSMDFPEERRRVASMIAASVLEFLSSHRFFHADELRQFVAQRHPTAPASADRILRDLRQRGLIGYRVVNRRQSMYEVEFVRGVA